MKKTAFSAVALAMLCIASPAPAAYVTGKDLGALCQSDKDAEIFSCMNYVAGVIDYHLIMQSLGTVPTTDFCLPEPLPLEEATIAVIEYLRKSPQHNSFIAAPAVAMALHEAYPCAPAKSAPKKKKK